MKRQITLLMMAVILCSSDIYTYTPSSYVKMNLKGSVKTLTELENKLSPDSNSKIIQNSTKFFDNSGKIIQLMKFKNHKLFSKVNYHYSDSGNIDYANETNPDGSLFLRVEYFYNEDGFIESKVYDRSYQTSYNVDRQKVDVEFDEYYSGLFTKIQYKCDYKGFKLEEKFLKDNGELTRKRTYKYDYKYNLVELKIYNSNGQVDKRIKYRYNKYNDILESKTYISNRLALTSSFTYVYDDNDNWTSRTEKRKLQENLFTANIDTNDILTQRIITYYVN